MEADKVIICRLCLSICQERFRNVESSTQDALNFLLLHVNLDISHDPVVCTTCTEDLKKCIDFKSNCLQERNPECEKFSDSDLNGQIAYLKKSTVESTSSVSNNDICVFCMEMINLDSFVILKSEEKDITVLEKNLPELGLNFTEDLITCPLCYKSIQNLMSFINSCLVVEERLNEYCNIEGTNSEGQVELTAVLNFPLKNELKSFVHGCNVVKVEDCDQLEDEDKIKVKSEDYVEVEEHESLDIKVECSIKTEDDDGRSESGAEDHKSTSEVRMFKCDMCLFQTKHKSSLRRHMLNHKTASESEDDDGRSESGVEDHKSTSEVRMLKCDMCPFQTKHKKSLRLHMLTHNTASENTYNLMIKCEKCPYKSKLKDYLQHHMHIHNNSTELRMFKCGKCPFECKGIRSLQTHDLLAHKTASEITMYKCEICPFQTKDKDSLLRTHMLVHKGATELKIHKCELCAFKTKNKYYMRRHMLRHKSTSEVTMFKCDKCPYQSKYKADVRLHMRTHRYQSHNAQM